MLCRRDIFCWSIQTLGRNVKVNKKRWLNTDFEECVNDYVKWHTIQATKTVINWYMYKLRHRLRTLQLQRNHLHVKSLNVRNLKRTKADVITVVKQCCFACTFWIPVVFIFISYLLPVTRTDSCNGECLITKLGSKISNEVFYYCSIQFYNTITARTVSKYLRS